MRKKGGFFLIPGALYNQGSAYTYALHLSGVKKKRLVFKVHRKFPTLEQKYKLQNTASDES